MEEDDVVVGDFGAEVRGGVGLEEGYPGAEGTGGDVGLALAEGVGAAWERLNQLASLYGANQRGKYRTVYRSSDQLGPRP